MKNSGSVPVSGASLILIAVVPWICSCGSSGGDNQVGDLPHTKTAQASIRRETRQDSGAVVMKKNPIKTVDSLDELISIVEGTPGKLLVFDLYADWCVPCRRLAPTFDALAGAHSENARFFRIDVQRNPDIASAFQVRGIPLVVFMKDKEVVHSLTGLNPKESYERVISACGPSVPPAECRTRLEKRL